VIDRVQLQARSTEPRGHRWYRCPDTAPEALLDTAAMMKGPYPVAMRCMRSAFDSVGCDSVILRQQTGVNPCPASMSYSYNQSTDH